jgi:hypothetical protein
MSAFATGWGWLGCAIVSVTITLASAGSAQTIVRPTPIEQALEELLARFPNRIVVGFEELFDQRPAAEQEANLGTKDYSLEEVLNHVRRIDPRYRIELLKGGLVHVYPAQKTADPVGLLDIRLKEFSMPQDSCLEQAIEYIDERFHGYAPELVGFLDQRKERWYRSHRRQVPGVVGDILGDCFGSAAPGPVYTSITVRQALNEMAKRSLQVNNGEVAPNSPLYRHHKPLSWRFRFRHDADSETGLGGIPVFQIFR